MANADERMKILKMVQDGKISPQDGVHLIESLAQPQAAAAPVPPAPVKRPGNAGRFLHVCVTDTRSGKTRVDVRLPVNLLQAGMKMGAHFTAGTEGLDSQALIRAINSGETGKIVDVYHGEGEEHVEVSIE
jgi:hypothetical protein